MVSGTIFENASKAADECCQRGDYLQGVNLLVDAAKAGDAESLLKLGLWRVIGDIIKRDLPAARKLIGQAAAAGSSDAALLHANFLANGTGGQRDWRAARELIEKLSSKLARAAEQREMLAQMTLDAEGDPLVAVRSEVLSTAPTVAISRGFLSANECDYLVRHSESRMQQALIVDPSSGKLVPHPVRVCDAALFGVLSEDLVVNAINRRIARFSGTPADHGEPLQLLRYRPGGEYRAHIDAIPGVINQRQCTVLIYLNDGYEGGQTKFVETNLTVQGVKGDALLFLNITKDSQADALSKHAGLPVRRGVKFLATRWIRQHPYSFPAPLPKLEE